MVASCTQVEKGREPLDLAEQKRNQVVIQEDQAGELGLLQLHLKYYNERALKRLLNLKPSIAILGLSHDPTTAILGLSHSIVHVILR